MVWEFSMRLTKHHGLGNDFLVGLVEQAPRSLASFAREICDRRTGIGADGLVLGLPGKKGADLTMLLHNSDGSIAEMSGNGIRCLAQAHAMAHRTGATSLEIDTTGGRRQVEIDSDGPNAEASVNMGPVGPGPGVDDRILAETVGSLVGTADLGNPHLVLVVDDLAAVDIGELGARYEALYPQGINVEWVAADPNNGNNLDMLVWERGAGVTQACGTGATAAAFLAHEWGLVEQQVNVRMPGGEVQVVANEHPLLIGRTDYVASIELST
jgi:diaminopimelate epimerase|tara:strand:+ start:46321 stop:47127 length:807 start_codon:yes stop_codon:yes gene_type:complete